MPGLDLGGDRPPRSRPRWRRPELVGVDGLAPAAAAVQLGQRRGRGRLPAWVVRKRDSVPSIPAVCTQDRPTVPAVPAVRPMNLIPPPLRSSRNRWLVIAAVWAAVLALGIGGFLQQEADAGLDRTFLDTVYLTLQLLTLNYDEDEELNWRLEVARFVAPFIAASTILQTARVALQTQIERLRLRFVHDHVVVCGLDEVGGRLAAAFAEAGRRVVAVEAHATRRGRRRQGRRRTRRRRRSRRR